MSRLSSDSSIGGMNIDVSRLSYQQHSSLEAVGKSAKFINIANGISEQQLIESFKREGVSYGNEVPYRGLVISLASCGCHLTLIEQKQLLLALSRTPETKIISIPLFMSLFRYWTKCTRETSSSLTTTETSFSYNDKVQYDHSTKLANIRQLLELQLPHIVYILDVIPERLTHDVLPDVSLEKFARLLRASNINLNNDNYMQLINALRKTGLCTENDDINLKKLIEVCQSKGTMNVNNIDKNLQSKSDKATPIMKLLEVVRQRWTDLERKIQSSSWNKELITATTFLLQCNACGIQLAEKDIYSLWAHIAISSNPSAKLINTEENLKSRTLSLENIRSVVIGTSSSLNYSCMGNVMRDTPSKNLRKNSYHEQPSTIGNLLHQVKPTSSVSQSTHAAIFSPTALPWSFNEAAEESNLKRRVKTAIQQIPIDKYRLFLDTLRKTTYASKGLVTRYGLAETLLSINLRLNKNETEDLWSEGNKFSKGALNVEAFAVWMDLDVSQTTEGNNTVVEVDKIDSFNDYVAQEYHRQQKHHFNVNQESNSEVISDHTEKHHFSKTLQQESSDPDHSNISKHHYTKTQQLESSEELNHDTQKRYYSKSQQLESAEECDNHDHESTLPYVAHNLQDSYVWDPQAPEPVHLDAHDAMRHIKAHNIQDSDVWNVNDVTPPLPPMKVDDSNIDILDLLPRVPYRYSHHNSTIMSDLLSSNEDIFKTAPVDENEESEMKLRKRAIAQLQEQRPQLAVVFRKRMGLGSRLAENGIKCKDLALELLQPPFSLDISENVAWRLVCDMIGITYSSNPDKAYILYADVVSFLDSEKETVEGYVTSQMKNSLKRKLFDSRNVQGDKVNLFALTSTLRQRQRHALGRGHASWDATPDYCSVKELIKLLETIDVAVDLEEAKFICKNSSDEDETHTNDIGVRLGAAILFLGSIIE